MATTTLAASSEALDETESLFHALVDHRRFSKAAQAWSRSVHQLSAWESGHVLVDNPSPENIARHKKSVERLMRFGQLLGFIADCPEFEDVKAAEMVHATQIVLKDKFRKWHGVKVSREKSGEVAKEIPQKSET